MAYPKKEERDGKRVRRHFIVEWAGEIGLTQSDMARILQIDKSSVSRWFKGTRPGDRHLKPIADVFGVTPEALFVKPLDFKIIKLIEPLSDAEKRRAIELLKLAFDGKSNQPS